MNAFVSQCKPVGKSFFSKKRRVLLFVGVLTCIGLATCTNPIFNDVNHANLCRDLDKTIALPEGSPEQAVAYMSLGKHLDKPIYGNWNGMDVVQWVRDPRNPLRPLLRKHPQLKSDWDTKGDDGLTNADHYRGFAAGPVTGARILFRESSPHNLERLNVLLGENAGTDPESLSQEGQEALLQKVLVENPEGRDMLHDLSSRRLLGCQARGYRSLATAICAPGLALRWMQRNWICLLAGLVVCVEGRRALQRRPSAIRAFFQSICNTFATRRRRQSPKIVPNASVITVYRPATLTECRADPHGSINTKC